MPPPGAAPVRSTSRPLSGEIREEQALKHLERSRHWVWTAIDPESKLLLAIDIGPRTLASER